MEAIKHGTKRSDGLLQVEIPLGHHNARHEVPSLPVLTFLPDSRAVRCGSRSVRLSPKQFALLRYIYMHGRVSFEDAQDAVWRCDIGDHVVRNSCSRLSVRLLDADIPVVVITRHGSVVLEEVAT